MISHNADFHISYTFGSAELLDEIQPLWEQLNQHHAAISPHFAEEFRNLTFSARKVKLIEKYAGGELRLDLAQFKGRSIGYVISAVTNDGVGEIESIYIESEFRGQAIGDELMLRALQWFEKQKVHTKLIAVAVGNERAFSFYQRFGFYPRLVTLKQS